MKPARACDSVHHFAFEHHALRGELVRLDDTWRKALERSAPVPAVRTVLGEAMAASVLLASTLKFDGKMTLQLHGGGPLTLLVVQCAHDFRIRGLARAAPEAEQAGSFRSLVGQGRLAITIETGAAKSYQGIVPLEGEDLAGCLETYFRSSEQLPTRLWLAADGEAAAGMLLQRLPEQAGEAGTSAETWARIQAQAGAVSEEDLLRLGERDLLQRLFYDEDVWLYEPAEVRFRCTCSRRRIERVLLSLGQDDLRELLEERGDIEVACEFCGRTRVFDRIDVEGFLVSPAAPSTPGTLQ